MSTKAPARSHLYLSRVSHARVRPVAHRFSYSLFTLLLDLEELPDLARRLKLFAYNAPGVLSFQDRDHGPHDGTPLRPWVEQTLRGAGIDFALGRVSLLTMPRVFGYVFNPISIYYCEDRTGDLAAILYEVHNTFGGHHTYVASLHNAAEGSNACHVADKAFHVSPFMALNGRYRFALNRPAERLTLRIDETEDDAPLMVATLHAVRRPLTDRTLLSALLRFPFVTLKVIAGIHFEALRLWLKRVPLHRDPGLPSGRVTAATLPAAAPSTLPSP